jgi:hypothetical protein
MNDSDLFSKLLALTRNPEDLQALMTLLAGRPEARTVMNPRRPGMEGNVQALQSPQSLNPRRV